MAPPARHDPAPAFNFVVEIDGIAVAGFAECSGLSSETDVIEYREGNERTLGVRKLPGLTRYGPVTLRRGITTSRELWDWRQSVIDGQISRRAVAITLLSEGGEAVLRWLLRDAWIAKWEGPHLRARSSEVAIESVELVHEGIRLESAG
ncbi:MAG TPA: phage tail protein [Methylomirabilota bacterium]|jgi:phage tail-like protein|nr:phage tail protein [Methylomirabilota bacterium]